MRIPKGAKVEAVSITLSQGEDSDGRADEEIQTIRISTCDAGAGPYLVLTTDRWAIDSDQVEAFAALLRDVLALAEGTKTRREK